MGLNPRPLAGPDFSWPVWYHWATQTHYIIVKAYKTEAHPAARALTRAMRCQTYVHTFKKSTHRGATVRFRTWVPYLEWLPQPCIAQSFNIHIQDGPKVRRLTATTHGGRLGESFEVGKPCPETHRYAPVVSTFLERLNVRLAISHSSGQRARSEMRFSFASFGLHGVCLRSSMVPYWPEEARRPSGRGFKSVITSRVFFIFLFPFW